MFNLQSTKHTPKIDYNHIDSVKSFWPRSNYEFTQDFRVGKSIFTIFFLTFYLYSHHHHQLQVQIKKKYIFACLTHTFHFHFFSSFPFSIIEQMDSLKLCALLIHIKRNPLPLLSSIDFETLFIIFTNVIHLEKIHVQFNKQ